MGKLYEWVNWGKWDIYEGEQSIIVGSKNHGYEVFASKGKDLKINADGTVDFTGKHGQLDTYKTKDIALEALRTTEKALNPKSNEIIYIPVNRKGVLSDAHAIVNARGKGGIVIYNPRNPETGVHEFAHVKLGHLSPRCKKSKLTKEKEAIEQEIGFMKRKKKYNPNVRRRISRRLATYLHNDGKRASKIVSDIESKIRRV